MTTILSTFLLALLLGLVLTPLAGRFGRAVGAVDHPAGRRVHDGVIPRTDGLAIFAAVGFALTIAWLWGTDVSRLIVAAGRKAGDVGLRGYVCHCSVIFF
ncbi:hypothetical protein [Desulfonatronum thioautotrophicum]|uniref:hypothetical protein n=1 Tax=Desulfonatronum thioautotrophicum TaxID=617001 RepID=UPI0005EBB198|nr:hypothetical protein [Desulfonatronum thioautotrophicum]